MGGANNFGVRTLSVVQFDRATHNDALDLATFRQSLGTAVFSGMLGVTAFGLLFTPAFYTVVRKFGRKTTQLAKAAHVT